MAIRPANEMRKLSRENVDSLNLSNCNKKLLEEVEHEINMSAAECSYLAEVYVKDKDFFPEDGFSAEEINCVRRYLTESLEYDVSVFNTRECKPKHYWKIQIHW